MALTKRISHVGNSAGLTFDKPILKQVGWEIGTEIEFQIAGETITLVRHRSAKPEDVQSSATRMLARHRTSLEKLGK